MKVPKLGEGADPAAMVSFEMELLIMPRLAGEHVPKFVAATAISPWQPYIVHGLIPGKTLGCRGCRGSAAALCCARSPSASRSPLRSTTCIASMSFISTSSRATSCSGRTAPAVLLDFGLSRHDQLPDLMQAEFRLPFGTAPYMAPEQLLGVRQDPRSNVFALGVLLYFFSTGERPFGESETMAGMRRRLWRDPYPPRRLKARFSALAPGDRPALPRNRAGVALPDRLAGRVRT